MVFDWWLALYGNGDMSAETPWIPSALIGHYEILALIKSGSLMVEPFVPKLVSDNKIDLRISDEFIRLASTPEIFNAEKPDYGSTFFRQERSLEFTINPNERVLMCTMERLRLPSDLLGIVSLRSSYSRLGMQSNVGFVDPGFAGQLTLEVSGSSFPIKLRSGQSIFHILFAVSKSKEVREYSGSYQNQKGPTLPRFRSKI